MSVTWDELDLLVDTDTIKLRDVAWAEIQRLRTQVTQLEGRCNRLRDAFVDVTGLEPPQ